MAVGVGDLAPNFTLPGTGDRSYALEELRGHPVILAFYPGDNTPVCTLQLKAYTQEFDEISGLDARLLAISPQGVESHEQFAKKHGGFAFPLLADEGKEVGKQYGVVGPLGFYRRSVFVVGPDGVIRYVHRSATGVTFKKTADLVQALSGA